MLLAAMLRHPYPTVCQRAAEALGLAPDPVWLQADAGSQREDAVCRACALLGVQASELPLIRVVERPSPRPASMLSM